MAEPSAPMPPPPPPPAPPARGHRVRNLVIVGVVVIVVVLLVVLATVPVAQSSTFTWGSTSGGTATTFFNDTQGQTLPCASGARGTLAFTSSAVDSSTTVVAPNGAQVWASSEPNWTTAFAVSQCGTYQFYTNGTGVGQYDFTLTVRWSGPLL